MTHAQPLRLIDLVPNPGVAEGNISFGSGLDWDDAEILTGSSSAVHVFDSKTRDYKYRLGGNLTLPTGFAFGPSVALTPEHFVTVSSRVNYRETLYVFRRSDGSLLQTIPSPPLANHDPGFGSDFALEGNRLFVSILHSSPVSNATAVGGVLVYDIRNWTQETAMFRSPDGEWVDGFGSSISVEGNILAVGAGRKDDFKGAAYLFNATTRALIAKVTMPVPATNAWFGTSVLLRNGKLYVTSRSAVWEYDAATGKYLGNFTPVPAAGYYDWFGTGVEIVGDGLLAVWSYTVLYQFDTATRKQIEALRSPLDTGTFTTRSGKMKARGDILLTGAAGGTDPATSNGALLAFTKSALDSVVEVGGATGSEAEGVIAVVFKVDPPATGNVTVNYRTRQDSAREGMDYIAKSGTVTIPAGKSEATLQITVVDDNGTEPTERLFLEIPGGSGAIVTPGEVELWIIDNDPAFPLPVDLDAPLPLPSFSNDELGRILAAYGDTGYVGCLDVNGSGYLRGGVFVIDLQSRKIVTTLAPTGLADGAKFGQGLASDRELLAVGTLKSLENPATSAIHLYDRESLAEKMTLYPPPSDAGGFGEVIALGARHILVGLPFEDRRGFQVGDVLVYDRTTGAFLSRIESPSGSLGGQFGVEVTIRGGRAVIGGKGRAYGFDLDDNNRLLFEVERATRETSHITSDFGLTIQANEKYIAMGNPWDDSFQDNSGSVLVFDAVTGTHLHTIRDPTATRNANFGRSISLMGDVLAVPGAERRVHFMDVATGHERIRYTIPHSLAPNTYHGFRQEIVLTESHVITGMPWGRANYLGTVISFNRVKIGPEFSGLNVSTRYQTAVSLALRKILARAIDPDGGAVELIAASPLGSAGGSAILLEHTLEYTPAAGFSGGETVSITLADGRGNTTTAEITFQVAPEIAAGQGSLATNAPRIRALPDGRVEVSFQGIPGRVYQLQRSTDLNGWQALDSSTADPSGRIEFIKDNPPVPSVFYRLAIP